MYDLQLQPETYNSKSKTPYPHMQAAKCIARCNYMQQSECCIESIFYAHRNVYIGWKVAKHQKRQFANEFVPPALFMTRLFAVWHVFVYISKGKITRARMAINSVKSQIFHNFSSLYNIAYMLEMVYFPKVMGLLKRTLCRINIFQLKMILSDVVYCSGKSKRWFKIGMNMIW